MRSQYAVHRPVENAFLVRQRDRRLVRELLGVLVTGLILGGGLFAYTWVHIEILRTGYRVDELERRLHTLREAERQWMLEAAHHAHPERVATRAERNLQMVEPSLEQMLFYEEIVGEPLPTPRSNGGSR